MSAVVVVALAARMRLRISDLEAVLAGIFVSVLPPVAEGLLGHLLEVAGLRPAAEDAWHPGDPALFVGQERFCHAAEALRCSKSALVLEDGGHCFHGEGFEVEGAGEACGVLFDYLVAKMDEDFGDVDLYGADFVAGAAEGGRVGEALCVLHLLELRGEDGADGSGVDAAVGVAAGLAIDGAGVLAGCATNAVEGLAGFFVGEDFGAGVVHQDDVEILRAVAWMDAGPDGVVGVHALAGGGAGEELEHDLEVFVAREDLVDAGDGDEGFGEREAHAAVAFAFDDADAAGFCNEKVCAADAGLHAKEFFAEEEARGVG